MSAIACVKGFAASEMGNALLQRPPGWLGFDLEVRAGASVVTCPPQEEVGGEPPPRQDWRLEDASIFLSIKHLCEENVSRDFPLHPAHEVIKLLLSLYIQRTEVQYGWLILCK